MTLLWMDGFDHYKQPADAQAIGRANMLDGSWAAAGSSGGPSSAQSRTGGHSLFIGSFSTGNDENYRRIFGDGYSTIGFGFAVYFPTLAGLVAGRAELFAITNATNTKQLVFNLLSTGAVECRQGSAGGTLLATAPDGTLVATAWQHVEVKAVIDPLVGAVEMRVNGVAVISVSGVDTGSSTANNLTLMRNGSAFFQGFDAYFDDMFAWNTLGSYNNDFIGDKRVLTVMPDDSTAQADWTVVGTASGHNAINEIPPDDDLTYLETQDVGMVSEFSIGDLVGDYGAISAVVVQGMQRKTVAGTCNTQISLISGVDEAAGVDRPITENYTYYVDVYEEDPATAAPWTKASVNAAKLKIERTA